jgi:hypothetical protein
MLDSDQRRRIKLDGPEALPWIRTGQREPQSGPGLDDN